jgi:hypothetical protein
LDVHKTFIEVALHEAGSVRRVGRVAIKDLSVFAESLSPNDHVVLELLPNSTRQEDPASAALAGIYAGRSLLSRLWVICGVREAALRRLRWLCVAVRCGRSLRRRLYRRHGASLLGVNRSSSGTGASRGW